MDNVSSSALDDPPGLEDKVSDRDRPLQRPNDPDVELSQSRQSRELVLEDLDCFASFAEVHGRPGIDGDNMTSARQSANDLPTPPETPGRLHAAAGMPREHDHGKVVSHGGAPGERSTSMERGTRRRRPT